MRNERRMLAIAAASGRVGHVLVDGAAIANLGMSRKASSGAMAARAYAAQQIEDLRPDVVVTEMLARGSKKGQRTRAIIAAIASVAELADVLNVEVARGRTHANRFEAAAALARRYSALQPYLPRGRKPWEAEPKTMIYFEALALIEAMRSETA
jgi:hypothetical protein